MVLVAFLAIIIQPYHGAAQWGGEVRAQMGFGGDELVSVEYSDGSESSLYLGKYLGISAGPIFEAWSSGQSSLELQAMVGWSWLTTGPQKTDDRLKLSRFPVDLLAFYGYRIPGSDLSLRFGGGATYHLRNRVRGSGSLDTYKYDFDNALGFTGEAAIVRRTFTAGIRFTQMDASVKGVPLTMDASSVGLFVGITTPRR
jgi:hypothetical protein